MRCCPLALSSGILVVLAVVACGAPAPESAGVPDSPAARADRIVAARLAGEPLAPLVAAKDPDPWIVADLLCARGEREAAAEFAAVAIGKHFEGLAAYVASWRGERAGGPVRAAVAKAEKALAAKDHAEVLAALAAARPEEGTLLASIVPYLRAEACEATRRLKEAGEAFEAAALAAEKLGWLRRAGFSYHRATRCAHVRSDLRSAVRCEEAGLRIWRVRTDHPTQPYNVSAGHSNLGGLLQKLTEYGPARDHLRQAMEILEPLRTKDLPHAAAHASALTNLALVHRSLGEYDEAVRLLERALALHRGYRYAPGIAWALANLGYTEWERGAPERGLTHLQESLPLMKSQKDARGEALVLNWIAVARARSGDTAGALEAIRSALEVARTSDARWEEARARHSLGLLLGGTESLGRGIEHLVAARKLYRDIGDRRSESFVLSDLAKMLASSGAVARARETQDEAVTTAGEDRTALAGALRVRGDLLVREGEYPAAADSYSRAAELLERTGDLASRADLWNSQGGLAWRTGRLRDALAAFEKSRALNEKIGDQDGLAGASTNLGLVHGSLGNLAEAVGHLEAALAIRLETADLVGEAGVRVNLANTLLRRGRTASALSHIETALALARRGGDRSLEATALDNLAGLRGLLGAPDGGRAEIERASALYESLGDRIGLARARTSLGALLHDQGRYREAKEQFEAALRIQDDLGADLAAALTRENLGAVHVRLEEWELARARMREAEAAFRSQGALVNASHCAVNLAESFVDEGRFEVAVAAYGPVLEEAERLGERRTLAFAFSGLAEALAGRGDHRKAIAAARRAVEESRFLAVGFGEREGASLRTEIADAYEFLDVGVRSAMHLGSAADLSFFLETGRAGSLEEILHGRELLREAGIPSDLRKEELEARIDEAEALRDHRLALVTNDEEAIREARRRLDDRRDRVRKVVERIQRAQRLGAGVISSRVGSLAEIQGALRPGECLVVYGIHEALVSALVVTPKSARTVDLGRAGTLDAPSRGVLRVGRRGARGVVVADDVGNDAPSSARSLAELRRRVVEPLRLDPETRRLLISPAGILSYVPFRLLLDVPEIVHVPSGTTYGLLRAQRTTEGKGVLALGDPDYEKDVDASGRSVTAFEAALPMLPGTRREVLAVGDVTLLREKATEDQLVRSLEGRPRWRAVHLACHGLVDPERPARSALALTPDEAGDGFLTYVDLCLLRLPADLVVLSACETARGRVYGAEGIVGLTSALLHAGASTVLCSLWKVDDAATQALMVKFYELWRGGNLSVAAALAGAQAHVRAQPEWKDPYFWAAWVVWGRGD